MSEAAPAAAFRLPRTTYLVALFLLFGAIPLAFTAGEFSFDAQGNSQGAPATVGWQTLIMLVPITVALAAWRIATFVDAGGIRVRATFGSRRLGWDEVRGLSVTGRSVYAVTAAGSVRLPCVGVAQLASVARASGGRLPEIAEPTRKYAPARRARR